MCGIYAYLNFKVSRSKREILEILLNGITRMEYRGYDSAGLAIDSSNPFSPSGSITKKIDSIELINEHGDNDVDANQSEQSTLSSSSSTIPAYMTKIIKSQGKVSHLRNLVFNQTFDIDFDTVLSYHVGIAHTRWATHGVPSQVNSHPQTSDPNNEFVVVHNGIISNYKEIRTLLEKHLIFQQSCTDTELIVLLMKYIYDSYKNQYMSFLDLVNLTVKKLEGAFAIVVKSSHYPNECIATRRSSPLIIGVKNPQPETISNDRYDIGFIQLNDLEKNIKSCSMPIGYRKKTRTQSGDSQVEYFIASDASAIVEHTKYAVYLEENDIAYIDQNGNLSIHQVSQGSTLNKNSGNMGVGDIVQYRDLCMLDIELDQIMKGNFKTFMEKEIYEQPESLMNMLRGRIDFNLQKIILGGLSNHLKEIKRCRRIIFIACGTSYHSTIATRPLFDQLVDIPIIVEIASDFSDRKMPIYRDDACVFVSQSGETADSLVALRYCKQMGAILIGVTNVVGSTISRETHCGVHLNVGPEIGVASTKAYTSQILALNLIACLLANDSISKVDIVSQIINQVNILPSLVKNTIQVHDQIKQLASSIKGIKNMLIIGRGYHHATSLEAALKIKELSYIHSEGLLSGELKHGPLALVDSELCIVMIIAYDSLYEKSLNALEQILSRNAKPIIICDEKCVIDSARVKAIIRVPHTIENLQTITSIIPFQLLAMELATISGNNVDFPRNLAKSVTVE